MTDSTLRLEPFVLLAQSTKGAAAAKVIIDATAAVSLGRLLLPFKLKEDR